MDDQKPDESKLKVYFNPFAFTIEQNNEFLRLGFEVMPLSIPNMDRDNRP